VLAHARDVLAAQVAEARVLRLSLVVLEVPQERLVLHHRVVDLALQEVGSAIHRSPRGKGLPRAAVHTPRQSWPVAAGCGGSSKMAGSGSSTAPSATLVTHG
jgi:hypothetical protein